MFGIVLVLLLASRAVFVFPIMALHNLWGSEKLPLRQIVVAWCARRAMPSRSPCCPPDCPAGQHAF